MNSSQQQDRQSTAQGGWLMPIITVIGVAIAIVGALYGSGVLGGTPTSEAAGGALGPDATPVAPASSAFRIWSVIYMGLLAYAIWQLTANARRSPRQRALRPWAIASALLNALWLGAVQLDMLVVSVLVIVVLLAVLIRIMYLLAAPRTGGWVELIVVDGTFGLYLGWVSVAMLANVYATLVSNDVYEASTIVAGILGVLVAAAIGVATAVFSRGRIAPALATTWALVWIAVARTDGQFDSAELVWTAAASAAVVVVAGAVCAGLALRRGGSGGDLGHAKAGDRADDTQRREEDQRPLDAQGRQR